MSKDRHDRSKVEVIKEQSDYLRAGLAEQLDSAASHVDETGLQLLKFSGMYQQDDRDQRRERRRAGLDKAYSFMIRSKLPGGVLSAEQYLLHDDLADRFGNGTLRFTTRQGVQLHGVLKGDIRATLRELDERLVTTLAACGDVSRNVMACPFPHRHHTDHHAARQALARAIDTQLLPRSGAYYELWLDGERLASPPPAPHTPSVDAVEPIYGKTYLPRKFKIGIAAPDDNCIDVFTQDIGIVPVHDGGEPRGYNLLVGGGLGMSHTKADTFPRLADPLGFVSADEVVRAVEVIVTIQRDFGNRADRRQARMKYLLHAWGVERFRAEFERRFGARVAPWVDVGPFAVDDHLGWRAQGDGRYCYGLPVENGRIADRGERRLKSALRAVAERFGTELRVTPQHDLLITDLAADDHEPLLTVLRSHGVSTVDDISNARRSAMACPALPTCGLALAESERVMPALIDRIERELADLGLADERIGIRMTGCPNGCARPYTAELAFVGSSLDLYHVYLGGSFEGLHLAAPYAEQVPGDQLVDTVRPLLAYWRQERLAGERFGAFCRRKGFADLRAHAAAPLARAAR